MSFGTALAHFVGFAAFTGLSIGALVAAGQHGDYYQRHGDRDDLRAFTLLLSLAGVLFILALLVLIGG